MDGNYKEWLYMKRGIFCFPLFSIAESWLYTSNRMIFAAQATVAFLHEDLGAEWWKLQRGLGNCCGDVRWWACLKEDMLYASGMLCPHNATHLKKAWKSCQTLHATVVDVYKIDKNCQEDPSFLSIGSERSSQVTWDMAHGQMQRSFWTKHWTIYQRW